MRIERPGGGVSVAYVEGSVDRFTAPAIPERLEEAAHDARHLVVDLSRVGFVDSAGLHQLFGIARAGRDAGRRVSFVLPDASPLSRVLEVVRLADVSPVHRDVESALRAAAEGDEAAPSREGGLTAPGRG